MYILTHFPLNVLLSSLHHHDITLILIISSVELQKANLDAQKGEGGGGGGAASTSSSSSAIAPASGGSGTSSNNTSNSGSNNNSSSSSALPPLAKLLSNPLLTALGSLGSLNELLNAASGLPSVLGGGGGGGGMGGGGGGGGGPPVQTTGVHRRTNNSSFQPKIKTSGSPPPKNKSDRNKFAPY
jgi:hypothetical protein